MRQVLTRASLVPSSRWIKVVLNPSSASSQSRPELLASDRSRSSQSLSLLVQTVNVFLLTLLSAITATTVPFETRWLAERNAMISIATVSACLPTLCSVSLSEMRATLRSLGIPPESVSQRSRHNFVANLRAVWPSVSE